MKLMTSMPREVIETQLARILKSTHFYNSPRLSRFLSYVVQESLAGRPDHLKGYTIGLEVFDKSDDFDPQVDTIVRVQARSLRQKLDQYYAQEGRDDPVHITIEKGSYSAAFFLSLDGEKPNDTDQVGFASMSSKPSIVMLPLDDFSRTKGNEYFSHGLTEETIASLSKFKELSVFSRLTGEQAKLKKLDIRQIYDEFGADFVLEGSFRIGNEVVDISINLVDSSSGEIILTEHFDHEIDPKSMYNLQDKLASMIASKIADRFGPLGLYAGKNARLGQSQKWKTYNWISQFYQYSAQLDADRRQEIIDGVNGVLENDPTSSDAYAVLALATVDQYRMSFADNTNTALLDRALDAAKQAVRCDPKNSAAHKALAIARFHRKEFNLFEGAAKRALALNPGHPDMFAMLGICHCFHGNFGVAMPMLDQAIALNPQQPGWYCIPKAIGLGMTEGPEAALSAIDEMPLPGKFYYHAYRLWLLVELNEVAAAEREKAKLLDVLPNFEMAIVGHMKAWCFDDAIIRRIVAAWRESGLNVSL